MIEIDDKEYAGLMLALGIAIGWSTDNRFQNPKLHKGLRRLAEKMYANVDLVAQADKAKQIKDQVKDQVKDQSQ